MPPLIITPSTNISGTIDIPGSKSYTNRALIIAALTPGSIKIKNPLYSDDTEAMIRCLKELGIKIDKHDKEIIVKGSEQDILDREYTLDAGLSGTTIRFILALSCVVPGIKIITGDDSLLKRPIGELAGALKDLGAKIEYIVKPGYAPLKVTSSELIINKTRLHGDISSQFFSALLMIAPLTNGLEVDVIGKAISTPYIDMTIQMMEYFGVMVENTDYKSYRVKAGQKYHPKDYLVEGDYSSAGYFLAIAALTKSKFTLNNLSEHSIQADRNFVAILEKLGSRVFFKDNSLEIIGNGVKPLSVDMENCPDQAQTLSVMLAFAKGKSTITGIRSLRIKETERILALQNELSKMGIRTESTIDSLTIYGGNPKPALLNTYNDHRMAMSFAVAGSVLEGITIADPEVVTKTFPEFWRKLQNIGIKIK